MKNNRGITLIEIMIAITLSTLTMSAVSGICLSANKISNDTITRPRAYRDAQIAVMHIEKNAAEAASKFTISSGTSIISESDVLYVEYKIYEGNTDVYSGPSITSRYEFNSGLKQLIYIPDISNESNYMVISDRIKGCSFNGDVMMQVKVIAQDNKSDSEISLSTFVGAKTNYIVGG